MDVQDPLTQVRALLQRGEREKAKKELANFLTQFPQNERAWVLMAQVVQDKQQKMDCYKRAIAINPKNLAAKTELVRLEYPGYTFDPKRGIVAESSKEMPGRVRAVSRTIFIVLALLFVLTGATLTYAKNNPESPIAKVIPELPSVNLDLEKLNPLQYDSPEEALIAFARDAAKTGMDGAPEKPGAGYAPSLSEGRNTFVRLENSVPAVGTSVTVRVTEAEATSMAAYVLSQNPQLPARNVQVYFRDGKVKIWCIVVGDGATTSALLTGSILVDANGTPSFQIDSAQAGQEKLQGALLAQAQFNVNQAIQSEINAQAPGTKVENVAIGGGVISVTVSR
ncbi:MAG: hypothetical protein HYZ22_05360 [Chloroflexi bacterium]|nr:hypothetical protein [Chloroflexota bacterium]